MSRRKLLKFLLNAALLAAAFAALWRFVNPVYHQTLARSATAVIPLFERPPVTDKVVCFKQKSLYRLLGVGQNASTDEMRASYEKLSASFDPALHPDNAAWAQAKRQELKVAFSIVADPKIRPLYDNYDPTRPLENASLAVALRDIKAREAEPAKWIFQRKKKTAGDLLPKIACGRVTYNTIFLLALVLATPGLSAAGKLKFFAAAAACLFLYHLGVIEILAKHQYVFSLGPFSQEHFHWTPAAKRAIGWLYGFVQTIGNQAVAIVIWAPAGIPALFQPEAESGPAAGQAKDKNMKLTGKALKNALKTAGPNDFCPCGSGKKTKRCHG